MKFTPPRQWRKIERHPLGAEYPDLSPAARERMVEGLRQHGVLNKRKITLHPDEADGGKLKVLDGWQLYQGCIEADVKPEFQPLPKSITPEEFVEIVNDTRRHESQETAIARAVARRERVLAKREGGDSIRKIAEEEDVSPATVQRDLESAPVPPGTPAEVKGRDKKSYPASKAQANGDGYALKAPYNLNDWVNALTNTVRAVRRLGEAYHAEESPPIQGLNRLLGEFDKQFRKTHKELSKKQKKGK